MRKPKTNKPKISERIRATFRDVTVNHKPVAVAMRDNGYSLSHSTNPHVLTRSLAWRALMDKHGLSDEYLALKHKQFLDSDNEQVGLRALDLAYEVKGKKSKTTNTNEFNAPVQIVINPMTPPEDPQV